MDKLKAKEFIASHPFFATFSTEDLDDLLPIVEEMTVKPAVELVREGDKVDSIFLIAEGQAKVTRDIITQEHIGKITQTILQAGDAIGLSDEGVFSREGQRLTSITSLTPMLLYRIRLNQLDKFMQKHLTLYADFKKTLEKILRVNFIKCVAPFNFLNSKDLYWLADQLQDVQVPAGTILFRQGDKGDRAYLIQSGKVAVIKHDEKGKVIENITLKAPEIFGELALISGNPRNATIEVVDDSRLLVIERSSLEKVMNNNDKVSMLLHKLIRQNDRPVQAKNITVQRRLQNEDVVTLQDGEKRYIRLTEQGWLVWQQIDGNNSVGDITIICSQQLGIDARDMVNKTLSDLVYAGLIVVGDVQH